MTYNTIAYLTYSILVVYITVLVGYKFHKNGEVYILQLIEDKQIGVAINNILLVLYYCLNIGFAIYSISKCEYLADIQKMINSIGNHSGTIILLLGILHYINMFWIYLLFKIKNKNKLIYK